MHINELKFSLYGGAEQPLNSTQLQHQQQQAATGRKVATTVKAVIADSDKASCHLVPALPCSASSFHQIKHSYL